MIKRLGWRRFLGLFWCVFQAKYFPEHSKYKYCQRSTERYMRDTMRGAMMKVCIVAGAIFVCTPTIALLFGNGLVNETIVIVCYLLGIIDFAIPVGIAISLMVRMEGCADAFFGAISK